MYKHPDLDAQMSRLPSHCQLRNDFKDGKWRVTNTGSCGIRYGSATPEEAVDKFTTHLAFGNRSMKSKFSMYM